MTYQAHKDEKEAVTKIGRRFTRTCDIFERHHLTTNADKIEFIVYCKPTKKNERPQITSER